MVDNLQEVVTATGMSETFAGITFLALIPNTAELVNAIQFSIHNSMY
jgi:Ca2+/H+ antiporter